MNITVKSYPANNGDSFLVSFETVPGKGRHILIDCGYPATYDRYIKPDLLRIAAKGECLERLILTHIDADHIYGAINLLADNNKARYIDISQVWFNAYRHLFELGAAIADGSRERLIGRVIARGYPKRGDDIGEKAISAEQGTTVAAHILAGAYNWNTDFGNAAVCVDSKKRVSVTEEISLYLLSPDAGKLAQLRKLWKEELGKFGVNFDAEKPDFYDDAFEMVAAWEKEPTKKGARPIAATALSMEQLLQTNFDPDTKVTNGSSIAFILEVADKKLLFCGDAHPEMLLRSLEEYQPDGRISFDLVKIAHHGSWGNAGPALLAKITAAAWLFSTNGKGHGHPDAATVAHVIAGGEKGQCRLYFNYRTAVSDFFNEKNKMEQYGYSLEYLDQPPFSITI